MASVKVFEDNELPVNLEDLPNFRLKNIEADAFQFVPGQELQTAKKFITDLQTLLMKKKPEAKDRDELLNLYDFSFNKICESVFKTSFWPTPQQIEESDEDLEIDITTQTLYQELCFRHIYARLQNYNADVRIGSWENYKDLFDIILTSKEDINLPVPWIWDILDEFIYQYQTNCQWRSKVKEDDPIYSEIIQSDRDFWNLEVLQKILRSLIEKGKILKSTKPGEFSLDDFGMNLKSSHYFAYFSLVGLLRTHTLLGDFKSALQIIEPIDFKKLIIYSKAYACYISLFFYSGFALIMTGRHREAVKIFEALLSFISKYKQFYSKSFQYDAMHKQADKTLFLLALALVFYPVQIEDSVSNMLKDRLQDKLEKLNKYDVGTFNEVFNFGCPKFINPILNIEHFRTMGFDKNNSEPILVQREALLKEFKKIQNLNNISSVLRLYTRIHLSKAAKVLGTSQDELKELLNLYKKRNQSSSISNPFETTIIKRFVGTSTQIDFVVDKDVIMITEDHATQNYTKMYLRLNQKVDEMVKELDNF